MEQAIRTIMAAALGLALALSIGLAAKASAAGAAWSESRPAIRASLARAHAALGGTAGSGGR